MQTKKIEINYFTDSKKIINLKYKVFQIKIIDYHINIGSE